MLAAHELSNAVTELHGVPGKKDRRTELRHRLVDVQARITEEMSSFSHPIDLRDIAAQAEESTEGLGLLDTLCMLAEFARSPDPDKL